MKNMLVKVDGKLKPGVFGKDLALAVIEKSVPPVEQATLLNLQEVQSANYRWKEE